MNCPKCQTWGRLANTPPWVNGRRKMVRDLAHAGWSCYQCRTWYSDEYLHKILVEAEV